MLWRSYDYAAPAVFIGTERTPAHQTDSVDCRAWRSLPVVDAVNMKLKLILLTLCGVIHADEVPRHLNVLEPPVVKCATFLNKKVQLVFTHPTAKAFIIQVVADGQLITREKHVRGPVAQAVTEFTYTHKVYGATNVYSVRALAFGQVSQASNQITVIP